MAFCLFSNVNAHAAFLLDALGSTHFLCFHQMTRQQARERDPSVTLSNHETATAVDQRLVEFAFALSFESYHLAVWP